MGHGMSLMERQGALCRKVLPLLRGVTLPELHVTGAGFPHHGRALEIGERLSVRTA
jgi:hypothetical protein